MQRPDVVRIDASRVQGEGAWIEWRRMTWGERKHFRKLAKDDGFNSLEFILDRLASWNWTDREGQALPLPAAVDDFDGLYDEELSFLADVGIRALDGRLEFTLDAQKN